MGPEKSCRYVMFLPAVRQLDTPPSMWGQTKRAGTPCAFGRGACAVTDTGLEQLTPKERGYL